MKEAIDPKSDVDYLLDGTTQEVQIIEAGRRAAQGISPDLSAPISQPGLKPDLLSGVLDTAIQANLSTKSQDENLSQAQSSIIKSMVPASMVTSLPAPAEAPLIPDRQESILPSSAGAVIFSPFRIRLWDKRRGGIYNMSKAEGGLVDYEIPVGRYIFEWDTGSDQPWEIQREIQIKVEGKKAVIEKARMSGGVLTAQVRVIENLIGLLAVIAAAGAGVGLAGFGIAKSLTSVDKVIVDVPGSIAKLVLYGGIGAAGYFLVLKPAMSRAG